MEKFFTQHNVMRDRDPDELRRVASDSEASDDEEEITDRVHSVHDPTGPWRQKPVDGPWGQPQAKKAGTKDRFFKSEHTGPKGVIKDYKAHKRYQREERERNEKGRQAALMRIARGVSVSSSNQPPPSMGCDGFTADGSDCECDDMLLSDDFLQKYNAMRMHQMHVTAKKRNHFGSLEFISPSEYVQLTDSAPADVTMVVHLYHPESYPCGLLNGHLEQIAKEISHVKFVALVAKEADDSITMKDLPVLLIYRGQQLEETVVHVSDKLDGEFTLERIKQFVVEHTVAA